MDNQSIKNILNAPGWKMIEQMFTEALEREASLESIDTGLPDATIARKVDAAKMTRAVITGIMKRLENIKNDTGQNKKEIYR